MPLGFERINERVKRPNALINFIRPLPGNSSNYSQDFLERVAAICYPIMKANHIAVMALEEYEWNPEFIGRNFNAGEIIQLVLRSKSGAWLPFKHVQMVMMHELAHCKQMNHSRDFWKVRDAYAGELRGLWVKNYTGEGFWGRGQTVLSGKYNNNAMPDAADLPEHTCGGTFRRKSRKRKRSTAEKPKVSYAERQQKRILKRFGSGGVALGDDEATRVKLEEGKKKGKSKPRVASSARGRDLRAAAALARFEQAKVEPVKKEDTASDTDSDFDWPLTDDEDSPNHNKYPVHDSDGRDMVRICEVEDEDDEDVKREIQELYDVDTDKLTKPTETPDSSQQRHRFGGSTTEDEDDSLPDLDFLSWAAKDTSHIARRATRAAAPAKPLTTAKSSLKDPVRGESQLPGEQKSLSKSKPSLKTPKEQSRETEPSALEESSICACCSFINELDALVCITCSNVLNTRALPNHWKCQSLACRGGSYINMGDYGICQVCGSKKP